MAQPAPQPNAQSQPVPSQSATKPAPQQSVLALPKRSPENQAEVERIRDSETYKEVSRDQLLFKWLSSQQESRASGFVYGVNFGDLRKSCQFYQLLYVRKRGNLFLTPTPVLYAEVEQFGSPTDLFIGITQAGGNPFSGMGSLRDLRKQAVGTLKKLQTSTLIIGYAEVLSPEALKELVKMRRDLKISIILAGSMCLSEFFDKLDKQRGPKHKDIRNAFLESHQYPCFEKNETEAILEGWENQVLSSWSKKLDLKKIPGVPNFLYTRCGGQAEPLYEMLRKIAIQTLDDPKLQISTTTLTELFAARRVAVST
ncbi:ATP-binding protein [Leptolyngbya ohadii]|uniref:ATP-binding protein n=1 Tax=Leptolyngbya ohadii TaxID=1962290 RepID=UPI000B5A0AB0|nr:ATP-binding protein [Leptolyngbya ohadii]